jgi:hypothetical protein
MKVCQSIIIAATLGFVSNCVALAACESFSANVPIDARHFDFADINKDGQIDAGDKLVGRDGLYDKDGNEFGRLFVVITIHEADENGIATKRTDTQVYALEGGGIFAFGEHDSRLDVAAHAAGKFEEQTRAKTSMQIIGGTGGYTGASGEVEYTFTDGVGEFDVNVSCK